MKIKLYNKTSHVLMIIVNQYGYSRQYLQPRSILIVESPKITDQMKDLLRNKFITLEVLDQDNKQTVTSETRTVTNASFGNVTINENTRKNKKQDNVSTDKVSIATK